MASERNQTLRLTGQMIDMVNPHQLAQPKLLPTPEAKLAAAGPDHARVNRVGSGGHDLTTAMDVLSKEQNLVLLPTPTTQDGANDGGPSQYHRNTLPLNTQVKVLAGVPDSLFPTPKASDGDKGGPNQRGSSGDYALPAVANLLPTPCANDSGNTPEEHLAKKPGRTQVTSLQIIADHGLIETGGKLLPTPTVGNATGGNASRSGERSDEKLLPGLAQEHQTNWGAFEPAIRRWERILGRPAPAPTEPTGKNGNHRLNPRFVEWMMGLDKGHVTKVPGLKRNQQLKALGNGVVPQQGAYAIRHLLNRHWLYTKVDAQRDAA